MIIKTTSAIDSTERYIRTFARIFLLLSGCGSASTIDPSSSSPISNCIENGHNWQSLSLTWCDCQWPSIIMFSNSNLLLKGVRMGLLDARKTDRSELRNTLEGTEHGKGAEVRNKVRKEGEMRNI